MDTIQTRETNTFIAQQLALLYPVGTEVHLFKSTFSPNPNSVKADFVANEVAFDGYAAYTTTLAPISGLDISGQEALISAELATFTQTGVVTTDIAGGYYLISPAIGGHLIGYGMFDTPLNFDRDGNVGLVKWNEVANPIFNADVEFIEGP